MKVSLEKQGINIVQLGLELEPEKALKAYEMACRQLSHKVDIPGFRRGKAPRTILEKRLGVDYIKQEALEHLVPELLGKVIVDENLDVITEPEIDECKFELGSPLKLHAKIEVRPAVELGQYQGVEVSVPQAVVPEDALERALESVAATKSTLAEVANRKIGMGDTVILDFECSVDGKPVEGGKAEGFLLEMKEGYFLDGFCEQLVDKEPGNTCDVKASFPAEYRNKELSGQEATFKVEIRGLRERRVPDVNDELAKAIGAESLDELKTMLTARLDEEVRQENEARLQRAVVDKVINNATVEIPDTMVDREQTLLMNSMRQMIEKNGGTWEEFQADAYYEKITAEKREESRQRVRTSLVLGAIVRAEQMTVNAEEMSPYLADLAARYNVPVERVMTREDVRRQVMEELLTHKVVEYLVSQAAATLVEDKATEHCEHDNATEHANA